MENEFRTYSVEEDGCCQLLQEWLPRLQQLCISCCCCVYCQGAPETNQKVQFAHLEYRPMIDSNVLTGNTLFQSSEASYYFPQTHQTLWPEHGSHYKSNTSPVISEQPRGLDPTRRSNRFLMALKSKKRAHLQSFRSKLHHNPASPLPSLAHSSIEDPNQPTLTLTTMHDIQGSTLTVSLKFASNLNFLMDKSHKRTVQPFISVFLLPSKNEILQTHAVQESNNPVFNKKFVFSGVPVSDLNEQTLVFQVYHSRTLIGITRVHLNSADLLGYTVCKHIDSVMESTETESRHSAGDIQIALTYLPDIEVIHGTVLRITNLRQPILGMHPPRPYINIYLTHDGKRFAKWKSSVHYDTAVQVFNEVFQFNISKMDTNLIMLCIHVKEYHRTHFNNLIGTVEIGASARGPTGSPHWQEVVNNPQQKISLWHSVVPLEGTHSEKSEKDASLRGTDT